MKRFLIVITACLIAISGIVTAFADNNLYISSKEIFVAAPDSLPCRVEHEDGKVREPVRPGSVVYFVIEGATRAEDLTKSYARILFDDDSCTGEEYIGTPSLEYRMLYDENGSKQVDYYYVVAMPVLSIPQAETVRIKARAALSRLQSGSFNFSLIVRESSTAAEAEKISCDGESCVLDFSDTTEFVSLDFSRYAQFVVRAAGQESVDVGTSFKTFTDIAWAYPSANIRCLSWIHEPIFNFSGTLKITGAENEYLYEIQGDKLTDRTETYSEKDSAFVLTTRRLGSFVVSDRPLEKPENTLLPINPPTGARTLQ